MQRKEKFALDRGGPKRIVLRGTPRARTTTAQVYAIVVPILVFWLLKALCAVKATRAG